MERFGVQAFSDAVTNRRSSLGDNLGAVTGGMAGGSVTSAAQDLFNGRPISVERAGESAILGNLFGGLGGAYGRAESSALSSRAKGRLGEGLGDIRSTINGQRRVWGPKFRDRIEGTEKYWYPDAVSDNLRFEDKFGLNADLTPNQELARSALGADFQLYHFMPADIGNLTGAPASAAAPQTINRRPRR